MTPEEYLKSHGISYTRHDHPALFTCGDEEKYGLSLPGLQCKTLFIKNKKANNYFLLILPAEKRFDRNKMAEHLGTKDLTFGSPETMKEKINLTPGSVSPFGLLNNSEHDIDLYIERSAYDAEIVGFHPNINTATLTFDRENFHKFLDTLQNNVTILDL